MKTFINAIIPVNQDVETKKKEKIKSLKSLILNTIDSVPATETDVIVMKTDPKPLGTNQKEAEDEAIHESIESVPFYEEVCAELMADSDVKNRLPKGSRFEVEENILRNTKHEHFAQLVVRLNWARRIGCCPFI